MAEYIFPKSYSYTEGSGSGSGSGGNTVPCSACSFPPGTSIDTHYIKTVNEDGSPIMVPEDGDQCCPVVSRTKDCTYCGFFEGTSPQTHYVDTSVKVDIDADGLSACCPVLPLDEDTVPCLNCGLPPGYDPTHWFLDTTLKTKPGSAAVCCPPKIKNPTPFGCIPPCPSGYVCSNNECILGPTEGSGCVPPCPSGSYCAQGSDYYGAPIIYCYTPCDPICGECDDCVNGQCVEGTKYPCSACEDNTGSVFPPGTSIDTHYIDYGATFCTKDTCCPAVERTTGSGENGDENFTTVYVKANEIVSIIPIKNIAKTGPGTCVIIPPPEPNAPDRPFCGTINIQEGRCVLKDPNAVNGDTRIIFGGGEPKPKVFVCDFDISNLGNNRVTVGAIDFGFKKVTSYTSDTTEYTGRVVIGLNGITVDTVSLDRTDLKNLLIGGRNEGSWDGSYGFVTNKDIGGIKSLGYNFNEDNTTTIAWAAPGDTNLDNVIDILDVASILANGKFDTGLSADWAEGDFNYDGIVDVLDMSSFLSTGYYDKGNYLPQNTSFNIRWSPLDTALRPLPTTLSSLSVSLSTEDVTEPVTYRTFEPPFYVGGKELIRDCEITTRLECNSKTASVFTPDVTCYDGIEKTLPIPDVNSGACYSYELDECFVVKNTHTKNARQYCIDIMRGVYYGENTVCTDQHNPQTKIITIPTTQPKKANWGCCCIASLNAADPMWKNKFFDPRIMVVDREVTKNNVSYTETAEVQCQKLGGYFSGYGQFCDDNCWNPNMRTSPYWYS
jgi:hypothetical protein